MPRRSPAIGGSFARLVLPSGARRSTRRAMPSSLPSAGQPMGWPRPSRSPSDLGAGPIRLRIGVHTGSPLLTDEGYVGADVHRAARIAAAGHGGQVLVSASTAALIDVPLRALGEHRFRDLAAPERVFQLGEGDFPPLKSLYRSNLPVPATPFLGRETELEAVGALLAAPWGSSRVAHWPWRDGQVTACLAGRSRRLGLIPRWGLLGGVGIATGSGTCPAGGCGSARCQRGPWRLVYR